MLLTIILAVGGFGGLGALITAVERLRRTRVTHNLSAAQATYTISEAATHLAEAQGLLLQRAVDTAEHAQSTVNAIRVELEDVRANARECERINFELRGRITVLERLVDANAAKLVSLTAASDSNSS